MAWLVLPTEDPRLLETLQAMRVPAVLTQIAVPRRMTGIAVHERYRRDALVVMGEDPRVTNFEEHPTNIDNHVFVIPRGPHSVDSMIWQFREPLKKVARRLGMPLTYLYNVEPQSKTQGVVVVELKKYPDKEIQVFGFAFARGADPDPLWVTVSDDQGTAFAEVQPNLVRLLIPLSAYYAGQAVGKLLVERLIEQAAKLAIDPNTAELVRRREAEERRRREEAERLRQIEEEARLEALRRAKEEERKQHLAELEKRRAEIGPGHRERWIEICRARRRLSVANIENEFAAVRAQVDAQAKQLVMVGWSHEVALARAKVVEDHLARRRAELEAVWEAIRSHEKVDCVASDPDGPGLVVLTKAGHAIRLGQAPTLELATTEPDLWTALVKFFAEGNYLDALILSIQSIEDGLMPASPSPPKREGKGEGGRGDGGQITTWIEQMSRELKAALAETMREVETLESGMGTLEEGLRDLLAKNAGLLEREQEIRQGENFGAEFDTLLRNQKIRDIKITDRALTITTSELCIPYEHKKYWIDPLVVEVVFDEKHFRLPAPHSADDFRGITVTKSHPEQKVSYDGYDSEGHNWPAPHVRGDGSFCLGNTKGAIPKLWRAQRWAAVIEFMITFLESIAHEGYAHILRNVATRIE